MRVIALVLAVSAIALARPQFRMTSKEYQALQIALDGRIPVAISSGRQLYNKVEENANNFVVVDFGGGPVISDSLARNAGQQRNEIAAGINDFGQGVLLFGQGVLDALGDTAVGLGQAAEDTLQGIGSLVGIARSGEAAADGRTLPVAAEEAPAVVIVDEAAVDGGAAADAAVVSARTGELDSADESGTTVTLDIVTVAPSSPEPNAAESETTDSVTETPTVVSSPSTSPLATEAASTASSTVTEPIDETLNEIVPPAPQEENASAAVAEARTGPVAAEDTAVAPAAPEEAVVVPPLAETDVAVAPALTRRKRQLLDDEEEISNARQIGTGLGTLAGLFGSTVGRFLDTVAAATVEMIDGIESLGTITLDQVENSFDDDPDNDFIRR